MGNTITRGLILSALLAATACCGDGAKQPPDPTAVEIVTDNARDALSFDFRENLPALKAFATAIADATTRQELDAAWTGIPDLAAKPDFLKEAVYDAAADDGDWPGNVTEATWAEGVRQGVAQAIESIEGE